MTSKDSPQSAGTAPGSSPNTGSRRKRRALAVNLLLLCGSVLILAGGTELGLRAFLKEQLQLIQDDRSLLYNYDSTLGWFPIPASSNRFTASRTVSVSHNSLGFRDAEIAADARPGIVFVGDSFVWGYDVEADERFTDRLRAKHPEWRIHNLGVSGYGTDQEFLLLQMKCESFRPKLIFLLFNSENDDEDNRTNARYGGYYKPYCTVAAGQLQIQGIPVPKSERAFHAEHPKLRSSYLVRLVARAYFRAVSPKVLQNPSPTGPILYNMREFARSQGSALVVGVVRSSPALNAELERLQLPFVDLTTELRYPSYGNHWTTEGHAWVAGQVSQFLASQPSLKTNP